MPGKVKAMFAVVVCSHALNGSEALMICDFIRAARQDPEWAEYWSGQFMGSPSGVGPDAAIKLFPVGMMEDKDAG